MAQPTALLVLAEGAEEMEAIVGLKADLHRAVLRLYRRVFFPDHS